MVLEEIENNVACLIPDDEDDPIYVPVSILPPAYEFGDVFVIRIRDNGQFVLEKDNAEKEKRLSENKLKRQTLLKRSDDKEQK
ncbi:MAG: DUF3006 family protein [Alkalibacterium sp.]|uniref:DUF3006 family protein n=1 Tax=Alkalibacterium sp. TaxID=1872447 RepID=UPI003970F3AA